MPTVETKIAQALQARVASLPLAFPVLWTDDAPAPKPAASGQPAPYIEAHHEPNRTVRHFIGSTDPHERPGILLLTLCWPLANVGPGPGKTHRDVIRETGGQIAAHFPTDLPMDFDGARVRVSKSADVLSAYVDDAYLRTQVRVLYHAFA